MQLKDIEIVKVSKEMMNKALADSKGLQENYGRNNRDGGNLREVRGSLAQQAVKVWLDTQTSIDYEWSDPFQKGLYGDKWDFIIAGESYDVKCRNWWNPTYYYNVDFFMGVHEQNKEVDNYIFTTTDRNMEAVYIYGAISYTRLWNKLEKPHNKPGKFPNAGTIHCRNLVPLYKYIYKI